MSEVFEIVNPAGPGGVVLLCDHGSNHIPAEYRNLGLEEARLEEHIAWDIGAAAVSRKLSALVGASAVLARFSRLVVDPNRHENAATLIATRSDDIAIPGNMGLGEEQRAKRLERYYRPFHAACRASVARAMEARPQPLILGIHSFTPRMNGGGKRPWDAGVMWDGDDRLALAMAKAFEAEGLTVGYNQPYSGAEWMYSVKTHAGAEGLPHAQIEIRQDHLDGAEGEALWALRLAAALAGPLAEF